MENVKYEFDTISILHPTDKILSNLNKKYNTGKSFTTEEAILFWTTTHSKEMLKLTGENGWQIKSVISKQTEQGEREIYYMQRSNEHKNFGNTINEEYFENFLYKEHTASINKLTQR